MTRKVEFELVSPEKLLLSEPVDMVVVPGAEGDFGVLIDHAPMISTIRPGVINVYVADEITESIFVAGGFADVTESSCTVLAEEAVPVKDLDRDALKQRLQHAQDELTEADSPVARAEAEGKVKVAEAMIEALNAA